MLSAQLDLDHCPHCGASKPTMNRIVGPIDSQAHDRSGERRWCLYACTGCGGCVVAGQPKATGNPDQQSVSEMYPAAPEAHADIPNPARRYLDQAYGSLHAPDGAGMLAASAVDAMLKARGIDEGSLYTGINKAVEDHLITEETGNWAHHVRLEANDPRHADAARPNLTPDEAAQCVEFAAAFAENLFVLPARVTRGIEVASQCEPEAQGDEG